MKFSPLAIIFTTALAVVGQNINLTGEVTSSVNGLPLQGVIVSLYSNPQCIDTTGADGTYQLLSSTGVAHYFTQGKSFSGNCLNNGMLEISVERSQPVSVESYGLNGVLNERLLRTTMMAPGVCKVDIRGSSANGSIRLIKVRQGDNTTTYEVLPIKSSSANAIALAGQSGGLAKSAAFTDTIIFSLSGFTTIKQAVTSATGVNNIVMQPQGSTITDIDGNVYRTVSIGTQVWMAENLKTTKYNDGTAIPEVGLGPWATLTTPAYCWYNSDTTNKAVYGGLYNWYAVNTGKLSPAGWHVPTNAEWMTLVNYLGGLDSAGGKLKEAGYAHWDPPNTGATNSSGFTGLAAGICHTDHTSSYVYVRGCGAWWSSTEYAGYNGDGWYIVTGLMTAAGSDLQGDKIEGCSIRCLKN